MRVDYQQYTLTFDFGFPIEFKTYPVFLIRSVLGMNLMKMSCINSSCKDCDVCNFHKTCAYSCIFESMIDKKNNIIPGRDKSSHPYVLSLKKNIPLNTKISSLDLVVTLFGKYIDYFPYILGAFKNAGKNGIGKKREKFEISDVKCQGKSILEGDSVNMELPCKTWILETGGIRKNGSVNVKFKSPLRYKKEGHLVNCPSVQDFFDCLFRRLKTICSLYGEVKDNEQNQNHQKSTIEIEDSNIFWQEFDRYSTRQNQTMKLGGVSGDMTFSGDFSRTDISLLEGAKLFGAGKNTNFGLGKIDFWEKWEE